MDGFWTDVRTAARRLARTPAFTAVAIAVLALGLGASTAIFSVVDHILLRPLDLPESDRVVTICETHVRMGDHCSVSPVNLADWSRQTASFSSLGVGRSRTAALREAEAVRSVAAAYASAGFFDALGFTPAMGRLWTSADEIPQGSGHVAVVSHEFWQQDLGGDPGVVGRTLVLDEAPYTVMGVLRPDAVAPRLEWIRVWTPPYFSMADEDYRDWRGWVGVGRLSASASVAEAEAELNRLQTAMAAEHPEVLRDWGARVQRMHDWIVADVRPVLRLFLAAVGAVLLIVCVNLASMLLARGTARDREIAVRAALGATRAGLGRTMITEALILAVIGGLLGLLVAHGMTRIFIAVAPPGIPRLEDATVDGRVVAFGAAATLLSALIFGLVPALRAWSADLASALKDGRSGSETRRGARARRSLVVVELALAISLVFGAGLLLRGFSTLTAWNPGFQVERLLTFSAFLSPGAYPELDRVRAYYDQVEAELEALPGVVSVGAVSAGPLFGGGDGMTPFFVDGRPDGPLTEAPNLAWYDADGGYFETLGVPVVAGRNLEASDRRGAPMVAVINQAASRAFWPAGSPVGARIRLPDLGWSGEIVGVVADIQPLMPHVPPSPSIYLANRQQTRWATFFVVRTRDEPGPMAAAVRATVQAVDPDVQPGAIQTLEQRLAEQLVRPRFNLALVGMFALVAILLGAVGIYGVVAFAVGLKRHEIGVRSALGADRAAIVRWVFADGARLLGWGVLLGALGAFAFSGLLEGLLYGVSPGDPVALIGTLVILAAAAFLAMLAPALRASRVDPVEALKTE